ncbi:MAG: PTS transporter subunit IIC [Oscillospiraceae bacterium]|nr:PTS transporter subunit IIC [Oscillospiraceae bacterium]
MELIQSFIDFTQGLGAACMMPIFVFLIGLVVRVPFKELLKASVTVGCGFIGTFMVMNLLGEYIGPISQGLVARFNLSLDVIDVGWPVTGSFSWAVPIAPIIFVSVFALNLLLIGVGFTRTLDVDIWNYWGFMLAGAMVYYSTNSVIFGVIAALITAAVTFRLADYAAPVTQHIYPGISFPHTCAIFWMPYAKFMDKIYDKIPGFNKLDADPEHLKEKIGFFGDPMFIGLIVGAVLAALAGLDATGILVSALNIAAVLLLLPKMVSLLMEGLSTIAQYTQLWAQNVKFLQGKELYIGIDGGILMGRPSVIVVGVIMIPIMLALAAVVPGNRVLPIADLAVLTSWFCWCPVAAKDNIFRGIVSAIFQGIVILLLATALTGIHDVMAVQSGYVYAEGIQHTSALVMGQELVPAGLYWLFNLFG